MPLAESHLFRRSVDHGGFAVWELAGTLAFFFGAIIGCAIAMLLSIAGTVPAILIALWLRRRIE